jgi:rhomboid family GlyGly-CTERM serine protease
MNFANLLQYDRAAILHGEVWRLVTGHFVHWSFAHLAWDLLAFIILGAICARRRGLFAIVVIGTALIVSLFLLVACPEVAQYRGLSAIDSALWIWSVFIIGERRVGLALTLLSLFLGKLMIESAGGALFVDGITVLPVVHLVGAAAGFCASVAEHKMTASLATARLAVGSSLSAHDQRSTANLSTDAALHRTQSRARVRRRRDESALVGGAS